MCRSKKSLCHFELVTCVRSSHYCCGSVVSNIPCLFFSCTLMFFVGMGGWILLYVAKCQQCQQIIFSNNTKNGTRMIDG